METATPGTPSPVKLFVTVPERVLTVTFFESFFWVFAWKSPLPEALPISKL
jgi:hypothetical protein